MTKPSITRTELSTHLQARLHEIEQATLTRINAIADPSAVADPSYAEDLRLAVPVALDYGLAVIDKPVDSAGPVPIMLLAQARAAARSGVSLDIVLRRYHAGCAVLRDVLIDEAGKGRLSHSELKRLLRSQATLFDRLLAEVGAEHGRELQGSINSAEGRYAKRIERLLAGEMIDTADIPYDFDAHHVGVIVAGPLGGEAIRGLAKTLNRAALVVPRGEDSLWAWLGGREGFDTRDLHRLVSDKKWSFRVAVAIGEPGLGLVGWRFTHRQAHAALLIAKRSPKPIRRYADVAVLASIARDDLLVNSLHQMYLTPLETASDGGSTFRKTLRAYFAVGRQASSAAAALGVKRHTVTKRLQAVEAALGQPLSVCATELDVALRLEELSHPRHGPHWPS
jgi:PucR C-terminal helix-turn-helix domain